VKEKKEDELEHYMWRRIKIGRRGEEYEGQDIKKNRGRNRKRKWRSRKRKKRKTGGRGERKIAEEEGMWRRKIGEGRGGCM
jgi:hypothetical protein